MVLSPEKRADVRRSERGRCDGIEVGSGGQFADAKRSAIGGFGGGEIRFSYPVWRKIRLAAVGVLESILGWCANLPASLALGRAKSGESLVEHDYV
jgi:hypothetical protein